MFGKLGDIWRQCGDGPGMGSPGPSPGPSPGLSLRLWLSHQQGCVKPETSQRDETWRNVSTWHFRRHFRWTSTACCRIASNCIELHRSPSKSIEVHRIPVFSMSVFMSKRSLYLELLDFVCPVRTTTINQILRSEWIQEHARPRQSVFHPSLFFTIVNGKLIQIVNHLSLICVESL
jgi:hypothetical protein